MFSNKIAKIFKILTNYKYFSYKCFIFHVNIYLSVVADKHLYEYVIFVLGELPLPFIGDLPEDGHVEAETCRRHIVK
jgi:hypothetical protein